jgi:hypothetical protein
VGVRACASAHVCARNTVEFGIDKSRGAASRDCSQRKVCRKLEPGGAPLGAEGEGFLATRRGKRGGWIRLRLSDCSKIRLRSFEQSLSGTLML